jgi:hypothetical protein
MDGAGKNTTEKWAKALRFTPRLQKPKGFRVPGDVLGDVLKF